MKTKKQAEGLFVVMTMYLDPSAEVLLCVTDSELRKRTTFKESRIRASNNRTGQQIAFLEFRHSTNPVRCSQFNDVDGKNPRCGARDTATLYNLIVMLVTNRANVIDGYRRRIGDPQHRIQGRSWILAERKAFMKHH